MTANTTCLKHANLMVPRYIRCMCICFFHVNKCTHISVCVLMPVHLEEFVRLTHNSCPVGQNPRLKREHGVIYHYFGFEMIWPMFYLMFYFNTLLSTIFAWFAINCWFYGFRLILYGNFNFEGKASVRLLVLFLFSDPVDKASSNERMCYITTSVISRTLATMMWDDTLHSWYHDHCKTISHTARQGKSRTNIKRSTHKTHLIAHHRGRAIGRLLGVHLEKTGRDIDGLVQKRRNTSALALGFRLSCTNPSIYRVCTVHRKSVQTLDACFHTFSLYYLNIW